MIVRHVPGMLTLEELGECAQRDEIDTVLVAFPDMYGRLLGKRVSARYFLQHAADGGTHVCDYLLACDMEMDPVPGYRFTSWESGYGDMLLLPDLHTLRVAAWLPATAMVLCNVHREPDRDLVEAAPRRMLSRQVERARRAGLQVMGGSELELYVFNESYESARRKGYAELDLAGSYVEDYHLLQGTREEPVMGAIRRSLDASGVPVESTKGEWGPGQQEINVEYCDVLGQADRNAIQKHAAKEIAELQGQAVTFMAKWREDLAGSSMHVHLSLRDARTGRPLDSGLQPLGPVEAPEALRWALGGMLERARELTPFFAPNVSSYKRFQSGTFAPVNVAWSYDNRTAGFRVVGAGPTVRIECRIPGADANPYLVYAALLAAALEGVGNEIEPPQPVSGDSYGNADLPRMPTTLREAIAGLEVSEFAVASFGAEVVEHYLHFFRTEQSKYDAVITDWEKARFFERI
jgi:glutamine synthetase